MAGGRRRPNNKNKNSGSGNNNNSNNNNSSSSNRSRGRRSRGSDPFSVKAALFVEGGYLSDWQRNPLSPRPFRGRNPNPGNRSGSVPKSGGFDRSKASGSKSEPRKLIGNAYGYAYPSFEFQEVNNGDNDLDESNPLVLVDSKETKIVAFLDQTPSSEPHDGRFTYDYNSDFVLGDDSHRGLGFHDEPEGTSNGIGVSSKQMEEQEVSCFESSSYEKELDPGQSINVEVGQTTKEVLAEVSSPQTNSGFLSIGGMRLYTQDVSDKESDEDDYGELLAEGSTDSSEPGEVVGSSESDSSQDSSDSDSDIDDEIAQDYLEGIGGSDNVLDSKWLAEQVLDESDEDGPSSSGFNETLKKLGGIAIQDASREYGMKKPKSRKTYSVASRGNGSSAIDDLMLVKDPRTVSGKKNPVARFPRSWPVEAQQSKSSRNFPGAKKKHHKELIAVKRRERMLRRGLDLEQINLNLEQIVSDGVDIFSFQPMHSRDCSQVQRLAAIYRLRSVSQGYGKKRFVTVMRTQHTCMPSSNDKLRLEKLIGPGNEDADFAVTEGSNIKSRDRNRVKKITQGSHLSPPELKQSARSRTSRNSARRRGSGEASEKKQSGKKVSFAEQPVSFVSSGVMQPGTVETPVVDSLGTDETCANKGGVGSSSVGAFEEHTKGFGSRMMAKMGYVEGGGLGKDGQGMSVPIEVIKRPKSLGLGVEFSNSDGDPASNKSQKIGSFEKGVEFSYSSGDTSRNRSQKIGAFERHTKGFGSKMMAKMGFVEGSGLGKDSQGIANPLVAVRLPKFRGLGAKS